MKIQQINLYTYRNNYQYKNNKQLTRNQNQLYFKGNEQPKKSGLFNSIKKFIKGENIPQVACYTRRENPVDLSEDEIKSENIKKFVGETIASYNTIIEKGKSAHKEIKEILKMGRNQDYKGTLKYNPNDNANVTFGAINPETNLPSTISMWKDGEFMYSYEILSDNPIEYKLSVIDKGIDTIQEGIGDRITMLQQTDSNFNLVKQFDRTENGFNYLYGRIKDDGNVEIKKRLYFDFGSIKGCIYGEGTQEGIPLYLYNQEEDLWEQKFLIEFEE